MVALLAALVIHELMIDPVQAQEPEGEWIELYNTGTLAVNLADWKLRSSGEAAFSFSTISTARVAPGGYLVLGASGNRAQNGDVPVAYVYSGLRLSDDTDVVELLQPDGSTEARVAYGLGWPHLAGRSLALAAPELALDSPASWCAAVTAFGDGDRGTPNGPNDCPPPPDAGALDGDSDGVLRVRGRVLGNLDGGCGCASGGPGMAWPLWFLFLRPRRTQGRRRA